MKTPLHLGHNFVSPLFTFALFTKTAASSYAIYVLFLTMNVGTTYPMFDTLPGTKAHKILIIKRDPLCVFFSSEHEEGQQANRVREKNCSLLAMSDSLR